MVKYKVQNRGNKNKLMDGIKPPARQRQNRPEKLDSRVVNSSVNRTTNLGPSHVNGNTARNNKLISRFFRGLQAALSKIFKLVASSDNQARMVAMSAAILIVSVVAFESIVPVTESNRYDIKPYDGRIIPVARTLLGTKLIKNEKGSLYYNWDYTPSTEEVTGQIYEPKFSASFEADSTRAVSVKDPFSNSTLKLTPQFKTETPEKNQNRVIYPLKNLDARIVYTLKAGSMKEDIILDKFQKDKLELKYKVETGEGTELKIEDDGSLAVYGAEALMGNVTTSSDQDAELLKKARANAEKTKLLFKIPAPFIVQADKKQSSANAWFSVKGDEVTLHATNLEKATYPLSIDPSVYIESASKLMRGNNETNIDFDVDNELIQKSQTTGARIDAWQDNLDMSEGTWDHSTAVAGGYIYRTGGRVDPTKPQIVESKETLAGSNTTTFTMDMPVNRPAGDLYVALMCHDGSDGGSMTAPSGWTEYADLRGHGAYYKVGTDQGGGNEAASYTWGGYGTEEWAGIILRISNFDPTTPISGTPTTQSSGGNATPTFPSVTPSSDNSLIIRSAGFDQDVPSDTGWVPSGHSKLGSNSSSGGGNRSCGYTAATLNNSPAGGVASGSVSHADASVNDDYGASSIAINPKAVTPGVKNTVSWAKFNSSTLAVESPNPGTGACSGWCNNSAYNLPSARRGHSMVAYNGYLYVIGGQDGSGNRTSTVYIAKLGANGEPQLWHPTDINKNNWVYWYTDTGLSSGTARSYLNAVAYNNRMYVIGGQTNASPGGITTVEVADILPNGRLGAWTTTGMQALPSGAGTHMSGVQMYNDTLYVIGGFEGVRTSSANLRNTVYYSKVNSDGTMNTWKQTKSFQGARSSFGGQFSYIWGAYIYLGGGCLAVNGSGYCTSIDSNTLVASINADGSLDNWSDLGNLDNTRIGYSLVGWQGGLYRIGGCTAQDPSTGNCSSTLADVDYGVINPAGEVSTVNISEAPGAGTCTGGAPQDCDLPPTGDGAGQGGQMLSVSVILNGYIYIIGGCTNYACSQSSGNVSYASVGSDGSIQAPSSCSGTSYGAWCVDSTNKINGNSGISAAGVTTFNNRIYLVGGIDETATGTQNIYYNSVNTDGSLTGAWSNTTFASAGVTGEKAYTYAYARANPSAASSNPGNLYIVGGCSAISASAGCSNSYNTEVYKCNIAVNGSVNSCSTSGQLQLDTELATETNQGLGLHSGTVYAGYMYLIGGYSDNVGDRSSIFYAKIDDSNNIVDPESGTAILALDTDDWIESTNTLNNGRRRGWAFGYNGHIYAVGGYDANPDVGIIPFIEWSKMNVSDGSIDPFVVSSVTLNQRWGLTMAVSNSYAYVIGGCDVGASPGGCTSFEPSVQTFQLYNNDSGSVADYTAQSDQTFSADTDRWGASSTVYNGYLYVAGGCISTTDCTNATNSVQYAPISPADGTIGSWSAGGNLPADRAWGSLEVAGGTLYYIGGQDDTATNEQSTVYYTTSISGGNPTWSGTAASNGLPSARTKFSSTVWNNRLYVVGGLDGSAAVTSTVFVSPQLNSGGNIATSWTTTTGFNVARTGAAVTSYANNLYVFGGYDGSNYLSDAQFAQINSDGSVDAFSYTKSLSGPLRDARAVSANGYIYLVGGRSTNTECKPKVMIAPISANTTIVTGNNPTGVGEWYETNVRYPGGRYGAAVAYDRGKIYTMGGGCTTPIGIAYTTGTIAQTGRTVTGTGTNWTDNYIGATITYQDASTATITSVESSTSLTVNVTKTVTAGSTYSINSNRHFLSAVNSQPQVAAYSRLMDTDTDVFPTKWLMNGLDNFIGARWQLRYRSMNDTDGIPTDCGSADMSTWGQETVFGDVSLGVPGVYTPKDGSGTNINCARYFYFFVNIDASKTFGYPEDVNRGPTIADLSLFFTADPSKRMRHGKTFTGGEQQPLDTPF